MSNSRDKRRQKKLEKNKKKRDLARQRAAGPPPLGFNAMIRAARTAPFGPVFIGESVDVVEPIPGLVTVLVTRKLDRGKLLPEVVLIDRTCLGVKNAFVMQPASEAELRETVRDMSENDPLRACEPAFAQSVVFHALDYARSLGFNPQRDFEPALFEPRPEPLLDTPLSRPERPFFVPGSEDDVDAILRRLDVNVGPSGYDVGGADGEIYRGDDFDEEDDDDDFLDGDDEEDGSGDEGVVELTDGGKVQIDPEPATSTDTGGSDREPRSEST